MQIKTFSQSGIFNPRVLVAVVLCLIGGSLGWLSLASTPSSGMLTPANSVITYDAGPFNVPNQSPLGLGQLDTGPRCNSSTFPCDNFTLTVTLPAGYAAAHPNAGIKVTVYWVDTGSHQSEYDLYVYNGVVGDLDGSQPANHASTSANPEITTINPLVDGTSQYSIKIVPYIPTHETLHARIELLPGDNGVSPNFGSADPTAPGVPRYHVFEAPAGSTADASQGEFNIGFNPHSGRIMVMNIGPVWRLTPPEILVPAKPECCEALWEDRSTVSANIGLDPILFTDQLTGRTFVSNSTAGANAVYAYSDSDGEPSTTQPTGWTEGGFSPPNGGADHETIGSGPYPATLPWSGFATPQNQGHAVYYCSQDIVGPASCQRSDDLGVSYGPGVLAYTGNGLTSCGGLHGHLHVAPDGTAWLPVRQCAGVQGGAFSTTAGTTWNEFIVTGSQSQPQGADPSIAIDNASNIYYAYVNNEPVAPGSPPEGHPRVRSGHRNPDNTVTWGPDVDLGASHGIRNAVEIEAVGGSSSPAGGSRAAVGFLGTNVNGDYQSVTFPGKWYAFIATTYDGGQTWTTVNATPNDPVQSLTGVWQQGGNQPDRNLLDFNEITVDDKGRVLYGYSDGCVSSACIAGAAPNDFVADMRVARQSGGKTLFESYDPNTDTTTAKVPKAACLSGTRDSRGSHLSWKVPDNGGADITSYEIWRGTASGTETKLFTTLTADPHYTDRNPPNKPHVFYYVKAINSAGTGSQSNEIDLVKVNPPPPQSPCAAPGVTLLTDPAGDTSLVLGLVSTPAPPGSDLLSFQLAQPFQADGILRLVFTINTDPGQSPQPIGSAWYVAMKIVKGTTTTYKGVHMIWNGTTPTFESYNPGANGVGGVDGRFVDSVIAPAEPGSSYDAPFNKVVIIVKASDLGLKSGDTISGFVSGVSQTEPGPLGGTITALYDGMPDSLGFANSYRLTPNAGCIPVSVSASPTQIHETESSTYTISIPQAVSLPLTIHFGMSGTALWGKDYIMSVPQGSGRVTIPAGQTSAVVTLNSLEDIDPVVNEPNSTAIMTLQPGNYFAGLPPNTATITILP